MVLCFDPKTKRHSMEWRGSSYVRLKWRGSSSVRLKKFELRKSLLKTLLIAVVMLPGLPTASLFTVNSHCYLDVMERLYARMRLVRCEQLRDYSWCCCVTTHLITARFMKQFLAPNWSVLSSGPLIATLAFEGLS
jgi:hypothetical protein